MWTSPCFNHTLPLGVTVALHQACLVAKNGRQQVPLEEPLPGAAGRPRGFRKEGTGLQRGLHVSVPIVARQALWTLPALDLQPGRGQENWLELPCSGGWVGMRKSSSLPVSIPLSSSWPPTFITPEMSQLAGLIQKLLFFYCRNALDKTSCSLNLCHKMEQAPPGGG